MQVYVLFRLLETNTLLLAESDERISGTPAENVVWTLDSFSQ